MKSSETTELSPAVKFLVDSAVSMGPEEFKFTLESYEGRYALEMTREALASIDGALVSSANASLLLRRVKQLEREAK